MGFLFGVVGLGLLGFGVYRATAGTRVPMARGAYRKAVEVMFTSLIMAVGGLTVLVYAASGSILSAIGGLVVGAVGAVVGGRALFRGMIRQVGGSSSPRGIR